jgi:oligoribonuclease NrnB/cAMP/cGMP phosphodiesterase (DHH superfamily)
VKRLVLYHGGCVDGFTAAWAAWRRFGDLDTEYVPAHYGKAPPDVTGRHVYCVDFSYPRDLMISMSEKAESLNVFDHHKTAQAALEGLSFATFDMQRSGAGLTWDQLHGPVRPGADHRGPFVGGTSRPWLVDYVEDRDLWRFKLPDSRAVNAWIGVAPWARSGATEAVTSDYRGPNAAFRDWDTLAATPLDEAVRKGEVVVRCENNFIDNMSLEARAITLQGHRVPCVNTPRVNVSELLNTLAKQAPFAVGWHQRGDGLYAYSLRSTDEGVDVSEIAKLYGGGGHRNASGFNIKERLPETGDEMDWLGDCSR